MRSGTLFFTVKLVIALPDDPSIFICRMPDLRTVPAAAVPAFYFTEKNTYAAAAVSPAHEPASRFAPGQTPQD